MPGNEDAILRHFRAQFQTDRASDRVRPLAHYQRIFHGFDEAIAREYAALAKPGVAEMPSSGPAPESGEEVVEGARRAIGHYRIVRELGRGGQGTVYLAEDSRLSRQVAIKVLAPGLVTSQSVLDRFRREAEIASRLDHPGICTIYEAGEAEGQPYIAMRFVDGETLAAQIASAREAVGTTPSAPGASRRSSGASSRPQVMRLVATFEKVARALHVAHEAGLIHRDVKPANVMIAIDDEPVVLDFGLAREAEGDGNGLTMTGMLLGTPAYMSPEQLMAQRIRLDRRTDVYSLGVAMYEAVTLRLPFDAPTREGLYQKILTTDATDPRRINPAIPADLRIVIETAMEKDRDRRYQTALELAEDLRRVRELQPIEARAVSPLGRLLRWARRNPALAASVFGLFAALAAGLLVSLHLLDRAELSAREALTAAADARRATDAERLATASAQRAAEREREARAAAEDVATDLRAALRRSEGLRLVARSTAVLPTDPSLALLLGIEGARKAPGLAANNALLAALEQHRELRAWHQDPLPTDTSRGNDTAASFSPDGSMVATVAQGCDVVRVLRVSDGAEVARAPLGQPGCTVRWSRDGRSLAVCTPGYGVVIFEGAGLARPTKLVAAPPRGGGNYVSTADAQFDHTGRRVIAWFGGADAYVWDLASPGEPLVLRGHSDCIRAIAVSPMSDLVTTASDDRTARVWDLTSGTERSRLVGHDSGVLSVAFSPDGSRVVTGSVDGAARLWNPVSGECLAELAGGERFVEAVAFDPKGRRVVTGGWDGEVRVWDASTGHHVSATDLSSWITDVSFSPDGVSCVAATMEGEVVVCPSDGGDRRLRLRGHRDRANSVEFDSTGRRVVSTGRDGSVRVWDVAPRPRRGFPPEAGLRLLSQGASPDRRLVAVSVDAGLDRRARVTDVATGSVLAEVTQGDGAMNSVSFSPDGERIVTSDASDKKAAVVWDARSGGLIVRLEGAGAEGVHSEFDLRGERVVTTDRMHVRIYDLATGRQLQEAMLTSGGYVRHAAFDASGDLVVASCDDGTAQIWPWRSGPAVPLRGHAGRVTAARFAGSGCVVTSSVDGTVRLWDVSTGKQGRVIDVGCPLLTVACSRDGLRIAAAGDDGVVRIWDAKTGDLVRTLAGHTGPVYAVGFLEGDERVVSASDDESVRVWRLDTGAEEATYHAARGRVIAWWGRTRIERVAALAGHRTSATPQLRSLVDGSVVATLRGHTREVNSATFAPDGSSVATASDDGSVCLWRVADGVLLRRLPGTGGAVLRTAFDRSGTRLLALCVGTWIEYEGGGGGVTEASVAVIYDLQSGGELARVRNVNGADFAGDGRRIVTCSSAGAELRDTLTGAVLREFACGYADDAVTSPDGRYVAATPRSSPPVVWDAATGAVVASLRSDRLSAWTKLAWSPSGQFVLTKGASPQVWRVYEVPEFQEVMTLSGVPAGCVGGFTADSSNVAYFHASGAEWTVPLDLVTAAERVSSRGLTPEERRTFDVELPSSR